MKINKTFCGISVICVEKNRYSRVLKILSGAIKIVKTESYLTFYLFGFQLFSKFSDKDIKQYDKLLSLESGIEKILLEINDIKSKMYYHEMGFHDQIKTLLSVQSLHSKIFPQFKNIHKGQDIVIVGTGPSVSNYVPIKNAIHISLNRAFKLNNINFDYLFMLDYTGVKTYIEDAQYCSGKKFYGKYTNFSLVDSGYNIPDYIVENANAYSFYVDSYNNIIRYDIENCPLMDSCSIAFPALQFALYTHPKRIYLVGCDSNKNGHFYNESEVIVEGVPMDVDKVIEGYVRIKKYVRTYYPDIEIISINPIGLKGLFKDVDTLVDERV